jgi:hypothetical protein
VSSVTERLTSMEHCWTGTVRYCQVQLKQSEWNLSPYEYIHFKSHVDRPGIELEPLKWEADTHSVPYPMVRLYGCSRCHGSFSLSQIYKPSFWDTSDQTYNIQALGKTSNNFLSVSQGKFGDSIVRGPNLHNQAQTVCSFCTRLYF